MEKIWIYLSERNKFQLISKSDPRLDWNAPYAPPGTVKMYRTKQKTDWHYRAFGETQAEVCEKLNKWVCEKIKEFEQNIAALEKQKIHPVIDEKPD